MGGEKIVYDLPIKQEEGSPPRGRGKAYIFPTFWGVERITPAWAGKSITFEMVEPDIKDHPRVGGEKPLSDCCFL